MGPAKQILGMHIVRDWANKLWWLSQEKYVTKVLQRFNVQNAKLVGSTLLRNNKLFEGQCSKTKPEKDEMNKIPYASAVGSLMYAMVCTRPDIAYAIGVVSRFVRNPRK